jgi:sucrose-6-phosphate hydrolase SacC (GH32 family)
MIEQKKILYPQQRLNEQPDCWAPCAVERNGLYHLFYTPQSVRYAVSDDLYNWKPQGVLFEGTNSHMRDPYIFFEDGIYNMIYIDNDLLYRTSEDLVNWSEPKIFQTNPFRSSAAQESPCVWKRNGIYYLMWCIYDGQNGCYDNRSFVFASKNLYDFTGKTPITMLTGHAPEIIFENGNYYIISVYYPENGLNIARISWSDE